jgi:hypothetical protein
MNMTIDEANHIVSEFRNNFPMVLNDRNAHGLVVTMEGDEPILELRVRRKLPREQLSNDVLMPSMFAYSFENKQSQIRTQVREAALPVLSSTTVAPRTYKATAGSIVKGEDSGNFVGTAGWNILLNNVPVCITNHHVICGRGNDTPFGRRVLFQDVDHFFHDIASLYAFQPILDYGTNHWDYALARFDDISLASASYRPCQDRTLPYPQKLTTRPGFGQTHFKVGAREPICRTGILKTVGSISIRYPSGLEAVFEKQLLFGRMTDLGDSGSVIVQVDENTVTGLNFALNLEDDETIANPLYSVGWRRNGTFTTEAGEEIPSFVGDPSLSSSNLSTQDSKADTDSIIGHRLVDGKLIPGDGPFPSFSEGKLFLGYRTAQYTPNTGAIKLERAAPVPIRDVVVDAVIGGPVGPNPLFGTDPWRSIRVLVLFFG